MIILSKLEKPYADITIRTKVCYLCDYCGREFARDKKSRERLNKIVEKDSCGDVDCKKNKQIDINIKLHGVPYIFQSENFQNKSKKTCLDKYGAEQYYSSEDFKVKRKNKLVEKYGVDSPLKNQDIKKTQQNTMIENYGESNPMHVEEFKQKALDTNEEKYGVPFAIQNEEVKQKRKDTNQKKYNKDSFVQTGEYWEKRENTTLKNRGCKHTSQDPSVQNKYKKTLMERYDGAQNMSEIPGVQEKICKTVLEKFGVPSALCLPENRPYGKKQAEITEWLNSFGFNFKPDYTLLNGKEIDAYDPACYLAFEYCGLYWHNEMSKTPRYKPYHYDKYKKCLEKGVRLITIFEDEWIERADQCKNFIKSILHKNTLKIMARKCDVLEIEKSLLKSFCDENHIQGANNLSIVGFGLFFKSKLVGCISLGRHPRKSDCIVLDRLCFATDYTVSGGASRLFAKCIDWARNKKLAEIISWSDNRWSNGNVYNKLGFVCEKELGPDYSYVDYNKPNKRISKQSQKKKYDCGKTEKQICLEKGLARIWDCGKQKWKFLVNDI